jgi:predicted RNA-binding Zn-ribbon protein involved in translation (DUF1610 family)
MARVSRTFSEFMGDVPARPEKECLLHDYVRCGPELAVCAKCGKNRWERPDGRIEAYNEPGYKNGFPIPGYVPPDRCKTHTHEYSDMLEKERWAETVRETQFGILKQEYVRRMCPRCGEEEVLESGRQWELKEAKKDVT